MTNDNKKVIIIGAGLSGLTLANSLQMQGIPFEVYERDAGVDARAQGWSMSLHFALKTLKKCVPEEAFENFSEKVCVAQGLDDRMSFAFLNASTGEPYFKMSTEPGTGYRINRARFRIWLLKQVQDKVQWNKKVSRYEENFDENTVTAFFEDGTQTTGSLLVGTDSVQSRVACQLLGGKEKFKELTNVLDVRVFGAASWVSKEDWASISENPLHLCTLNGKLEENEQDRVKEKTFGMFCCIQCIDESRFEKPVQILWSMSRYDEEGVLSKFEESDSAECLSLLKSWARHGFPKDSVYRKFVTDSPDDTVIKPIIIREGTPTAELLQAPNRCVVLVGDAAHPMSMFRGEGGNHAITDAGNLATELGHFYSGSKTLDEAIASYYAEMIPRGKKAVEESHDAAILLHTNPKLMMEIFRGIRERHSTTKKEQSH